MDNRKENKAVKYLPKTRGNTIVNFPMHTPFPRQFLRHKFPLGSTILKHALSQSVCSIHYTWPIVSNPVSSSIHGKTERDILHGGKHVTSVKVEITFSPNARKYMPYHTPKMVMAVSHEKKSINAALTVSDHPVRFQVDSAADFNTICQKQDRKSVV